MSRKGQGSACRRDRKQGERSRHEAGGTWAGPKHAGAHHTWQRRGWAGGRTAVHEARAHRCECVRRDEVIRGVRQAGTGVASRRVARGRGRAGSRREARRSWVLVVENDDVRQALMKRVPANRQNLVTSVQIAKRRVATKERGRNKANDRQLGSAFDSRVHAAFARTRCLRRARHLTRAGSSRAAACLRPGPACTPFTRSGRCYAHPTTRM